MTEPTYISECCASSIIGGRCESCKEGVVGEEVEQITTFGADIDTFLTTYVSEKDRPMAQIKLKLIVLKVCRMALTSTSEEYSKAIV